MTNLVSVIITCHNLEAFVGDAIDSVLAQDYCGPVEIVVVDDGSSDGSAHVIQQFQSVSYLPTPSNLGVLMATVYGLRHANGDVVFFLDGDDVWHPEKLRLCMQRFDENKSLGLLTHDLSYIDAKGTEIARSSRPSQVFSGNCNNDRELVREGILNHTDYVWLGSAFAVRRSVADVDGFCAWAENLPDPFNTYQDWTLAYWVACNPIVQMEYLPHKLFQYRIHGSNYSGDSRTVHKLLRNLRRAYNTMDAICDLASKSQVHLKSRDISIRKRAYYKYLLDLYTGTRIQSARKFFSCQGYIFRSELQPMKEWARFIATQVLGAERFVRVKASLEGWR